MNSKFKVYYYYHNINLWKYKSIDKLNKKKWVLLKSKSYKNIDGKIYSIGKYICHYKKLNITRLYYFKFINKQILKKYFVNYKEYNLKKSFLNNIYNLERRLDFNLYKANFVTSLYEAKFFITKGFIFVNKQRVTNFNYLLNSNDLVEIDNFLYNYILRKKTFINFDQHLYLRNLEIDYKTLSFIFLNKNEFFISNYNNFIKKIYFKQDKLTNINNIINNNFYKFFDKIFTEYLFLDKYAKILNKNTKYINNHKVNFLLKFIKYKYNDYYFRNILLKSTFNMKYNYLQFLMKNNIFVNYNFENINFIYETLFNHNKNSLLLNTQFFNYYYILIFNYYINILKNLNKININNLLFPLYLTKNFSINNYNYILLFNYKIFKLLNIKNKLTNYYNSQLFIKNQNNYNFKINDNYITKKINYKTISQYTNSKFHYNSLKIYNNLIYYISSYKFGYKIHKRSRNFQQNCNKRIKIIKKIQKSFYYTRFNCNRYGIYIKKNTKRIIYNQLKNNYLKFNNNSYYLNFNNNNYNKLQIKKITKQNNNKLIVINKLNSPYYPKDSLIYKSIYNSLNTNLKDNVNIIRENIRKLNSINTILKNYNDSNYLINHLYKLEKQLYYKLKFIQNNKIDYNFNKNFKDIYFLYNLIEFYNNKILLNSKDKIVLKTLYSNIVYKIHNKINLNYNNQILKNKNKKFYIKKYKHLINDYRRCQLNSYYINYNKSMTVLGSNLKSYFLKNLISSNNNKIFFNYYYCYYKLNFFNEFNTNLYIKNKRNLFKTKYNKKITNIYKSLYLSKHKNIVYNIKNNILNDKNSFNLNIVNSKRNNFNDKFFYIDLILNLTTRKFNLDYNKFNYYNYYTNIQSFTTNNIVSYKNFIKTIYKKNRKTKNIIKYNYKFYYIQNLTKIYNYQYLKYNNNTKIIKYKTFISNYKNRLCYNYNISNYNSFLNNQLFKYYYGYYNSKFYKKNCTKIYIKFNKQNYINNIYKLYIYYNYNIKKYYLIKYIYKHYIFKEYTSFFNKIVTNANIKKTNIFYIKQLYYNLLFTKLFNFNQLDYTLKNNYNYSKNLRIIINYFIIINRLYK